MAMLNKLFKKMFINKKISIFYFISFFLYALSFSLVFVANSYSSQSYNELLSNRISECATQNTTTESVNFNYQLTNSNSDDATRESLSKNITLVYDISRQSTATHFYTGRVIFDGSKKIFNFKDLSNDYPTIILSNIFSNHENPNGEIVHDIFELKLMYSQTNTSFVNVYDNFCYITLNQADELLHKFNLQTYDELINQTLVISTNDGTLLEWKIANIIIDGGDNEYYQKLYGDYVLAYYYTSIYTGYSISYDFASSINDNTRFALTLNNLFSSDDYTCEANAFNFINKENFNDLGEELIKFSNNTSDDYLFIVLTTLFLILFIAIISGCFYYFAIKNVLALSISCFLGFSLSYFIFWILYKISINYIIYFSNTAIIINFIVLLAILIIFLIARKKDIKHYNGAIYEEFNC